VHSEGGLRVVDDNLPEQAPATEQGPVTGSGATAPTPAEAIAAAAAGQQRPKRAPRAPREHRVTVPGGVASCGGGSSGGTSGGYPTVGAARQLGEIEEESEGKSRTLVIIEEDTAANSAASGSGEAWVPPWATPELQAKQLAELERLSLEGTVQLLPDRETALSALRRAQARGELLRRDAPITCQAPIDGTTIALIAVPPFYPTQPVTIQQVRLRAQSGQSGSMPGSALRAMERELRQEVSRLEAAGEQPPLSSLVRWLATEGPGRLDGLRAEAQASRAAGSSNSARADDDGRAAADRPVPPAAAAAVAAEAMDPKYDAFKVSRNAEKYSPNWDLCAAFIKNGRCKNKNCKWRHEKPAPEPQRQPQAAAPAAAAQGQKVGQAARGSGKSKK